MDKEKIISLENLNQYSEETSGKIKEKISEHTSNGDVHVTTTDKSNWNGYASEIEQNKTDIQNLQVQDGVLNSRIDNIATLPEGSTTADAELADIRVGADGTTYPNAGTAVRTQVGELKQDLDGLKSKAGYSENIDFNYVKYASFYTNDTQTTNNNHNGTVRQTLDYDSVVIDGSNTNLEICVVGYDPNGVYFEVKWGTKAEFTPKENYKYQIVARSGSKTAPEFYSEMSNIVTIGSKKGSLENNINEIENNIKPHNIIEVLSSDNLVNIINNITDSGKNNQYDIYISGEHDIIQELGGQTYVSSITSEMSGMLGLIIPDYVNLYGVGNDAKLTGYIPNTYDNVMLATWKVSTLQINATNRIENLTITAKNLRYSIHDESNGAVKNGVKHLKNLTLIHYGNNEIAGAWVSTNAYGMGASSGSMLYAKNCDFISHYQVGFACHDNLNFEKGALLEFDSCRFFSINGDTSFNLTSHGSSTKENVCYMNNCIMNKNYTNELSGGAESSRWILKGCNNFKRQNIDNVIIE